MITRVIRLMFEVLVILGQMYRTIEEVFGRPHSSNLTLDEREAR